MRVPNRAWPSFRYLVVAALGLILAGSLAQATVYVDDDAPGDPGPNDPMVSDPLEDGSLEHPFDSIQEAIDFVLNPCSIIVAPGLYLEDLHTPGGGCVIVGGGTGVTRIESISGTVLDAPVDAPPSDPPLPVGLILQDVTLVGNAISITGINTPDPGAPVELRFENVDLQGTNVVVHAGSDSTDRFHLFVRSVTLDYGELDVRAEGSPIDVTIDNVSMSGSNLWLRSSGVSMNVEMTSLRAGATTLSLERSGGGSQVVAVANSRLAGVSSAGNGYQLRATFLQTDFSGAGISISDTPLNLTVVDCAFEQGGLQVSALHNIDVGTDSAVTLTRSSFFNEGADFTVRFASGLFALPHRARLHVDACRFLRNGLSAVIEPGQLEHGLDGSVDLQVTNSLFQSYSIGGQINYRMSDLNPLGAHAAIRTAFINNTLYGSSTGLQFLTNPHIPGQHSVSTIAQNNIIAGGSVGIDVQGTTGQTLTIAGNDVHGNAAGNYTGDLPDQTGMNGNISADPLFVAPLGSDVRLQPMSPCIDAAVANSLTPAADYDSAVRPVDGDLDNVALPDIGAYEFSPDVDNDGHIYSADCNDANPDVWAIPGEVPSLDLGNASTITWVAPAPGGINDVFDTLRASAAAGFNAAACIESNDPSDQQAVDPAQPSGGGVFYYLVRAENSCTPGSGPLGFQSNGTPRTGRSCP